MATASNKRGSNERMDGGREGEKRRKKEEGREDTSSTADQAASEQDPRHSEISMTLLAPPAEEPV